ncbi:MAG: hypothetical protein FWH01_02380 [Oscillospiraceae bacterium]|nr:hypothetical protein [Oscillospiraceae bacterium]
MRGLKKLLALLISIALLATVFAVPVFAADEDVPLSNGAKLELLGLLIGDGDGVTDAYLAKSSTRMQLAILNGRWLAYEQEAYDFEDWDDEVNFVDYDDRTSEAEWNMLAYYYADPDLGFIGIGYDVFAPQDNITNKQLAKILLVAMGYPYGVDYDWDDILLFSADVGINLGTREVGITNSGLADAMVAALESLTAFGDDDEPMTFAQFLMELGVVTEEDLIAAGIAYIWGEEPVEPDTELPTLEVVSATASNFAEVELTFNQKVDPESVDWAIAKIDNLNTSSGAKIYVVEDYGDDKVVRIFEPEGFVGAQNEYRTVSLSGLRTSGGVSMTAFSQQITFRDSTAPSIDKVVAKGNTRLDVYFSEPINTTDAAVKSAVENLSNYQVGGKVLSASRPTINDDADTNTSRIVTIKSIRTTLSPGVYVLGVLGDGFKDFANNTLGYQTAEFEIVAKTEGPIAQRVLDPVYQYKVMIEFDDEIQDDAQIRWVDGSRTHTSDKTTVKDNVATFEFTAANKVIPIGGTTITLVNAKDYWNNPAQAPLSFDIVPVADTLRPAVVSYGADSDGEIWIKFNKAIRSPDTGKWAFKRGDDTLYGDDWDTVFDSEKDDKKVTLKPRTDDAKKAGLYAITIKGVQDTVIPIANANTNLDVTIEVDVPDLEAPFISSATWGRDSNGAADRRIINIYFNEEVDYSTAVTRGNYRTKVSTESNFRALPNTAKVELLSGNRTVRLTFVDAFPAQTNATPPVDINVDVSAIDVQDLYGNRSNSIAAVGDGHPSTVKSIKATGVRKIEVEFTTEVTTYEVNNFTLVNAIGATTALQGIAVDYVTLDGKKVIVNLTADLSPTAQFRNNNVFLRINNQDVASQITADVTDNTTTPPTVTTADSQWRVTDGIAPLVVQDSYFKTSDDYNMGGENSTSLFIIFNEQIRTKGSSMNEVFGTIKFGNDVIVNGVTEKDDYVVSWDVICDTTLVNGEQVAMAVPGSQENEYYIELKFKETATSGAIDIRSRNITMTYNRHPSFLLSDMAGNELGATAFSDITFEGVRIRP